MAKATVYAASVLPLLPLLAVTLFWTAVVGVAVRPTRPASAAPQSAPRWLAQADLLLGLSAALVLLWLVLPIQPIGIDDWQFMALGRFPFAGGDLLSLFNQQSNPFEAYFRPIGALGFAAAHALGGGTVAGYHVVLILGHLGVAWLVGRIAWALSGSTTAARSAALLFLVHPAHVEVFGWINALENVILGLFFAGAVLAHLHRRALLTALLVTLALLTKETGLTVLGALVLVDLVNHRRPTLRRWLPTVLALIGVIVYRLALREPSNAHHAAYTAQFLDIQPLQALKSLALDVPAIAAWPVFAPRSVWISALGFALLATGAALAVRYRPPGALTWIAFGLAWLLGTVLPALTDLGFPTSAAHSGSPAWSLRHFYPALIGPCLAAAILLDRLPPIGLLLSRVGVALALIVLASNLGPFLAASARVDAIQDRLDSTPLADNVGIRLVSPVDPAASLIVNRRLLDPTARTAPLLIGEPRCGCAVLPLAPTQPGEAARHLVTRIVRALAMPPRDPGQPCTCHRWRPDAEFLNW